MSKDCGALDRADQLRAVNAELLEALKRIAAPVAVSDPDVIGLEEAARQAAQEAVNRAEVARAAIAKATP